jgi:hypothetical protein
MSENQIAYMRAVLFNFIYDLVPHSYDQTSKSILKRKEAEQRKLLKGIRRSPLTAHAY